MYRIIILIVLGYYISSAMLAVTRYNPAEHGLWNLTLCGLMDLRAEWQMLHFLQCPTHGISGRYIVIHFHRNFKYLLLKIHEVAVYGYGETPQTLRMKLWLACNTICSKHAIWNHNDVRIYLNVRGTYDSSVNNNVWTNWFFEYITRWHDQLRDISYFLHHKSELQFIANSWN